MASKKHCDVCDSVVNVEDSTTEIVRIEAPERRHLVHLIRVDTRFYKQYPADDDDAAQELCLDCRRKAAAALFEKMGGEIVQPVVPPPPVAREIRLQREARAPWSDAPLTSRPDGGE